MPEVRESVPAWELHDALVEYVDKANASPRARKALATFSCRIHIHATDVPDAEFTLVAEQGQVQPVRRGHAGVPDLILHGHSMDLAEIFWGDMHPATTRMQGPIKTKGRTDNVMRLDATALLIFLGE